VWPRPEGNGVRPRAAPVEFSNILATYLRANSPGKARLVTEDARLRQAAPALTTSLSEALAA